MPDPLRPQVLAPPADRLVKRILSHSYIRGTTAAYLDQAEVSRDELDRVMEELGDVMVTRLKKIEAEFHTDRKPKRFSLRWLWKS